LCAHFLKEVEENMFESKAAVACSKTSVLLICFFLDFNKGAFARRPLHSCSCKPQITKIRNKNKTEARLKVILPKQDSFLL
jgi:hypothetical protein